MKNAINKIFWMAKFNDKNGYGSEVTTVKLHAVLEYGLEVNGFYRLRLEQCQQEKHPASDGELQNGRNSVESSDPLLIFGND